MLERYGKNGKNVNIDIGNNNFPQREVNHIKIPFKGHPDH